jgi:predicted O-methyltransferase YrrM
VSFNIARLLGLHRPVEPERPASQNDRAEASPLVRPVRPLEALCRPSERFEISQAGLQAWRDSPAFERVFSFYRNYPEGSLQSDEARALLHHLIVMQRPERVLEIGTWHAGTTETMARALWETGQGQIDTIDPFGGERCPPIIATFPPELRKIVTFRAENSAAVFDRAISNNTYYDFVLVDGNHEYEFALFDVMCAARTMRPGGLMVMDNIEQVGPRLAAKTFLERNPDWRDVAGVVRHIDMSAPFKVPAASFPETKFYLLQAPPHYMIREEPRIFGPAEVDRAEVDGIELELAAPAQGRLHILVYVRTFDMVEPEELHCEQSLQLDISQLPPDGTVRIPLSTPLRTAFPQEGLIRRVELSLAFNGPTGLALRSAPRLYPAAYGRSLGVR